MSRRPRLGPWTRATARTTTSRYNDFEGMLLEVAWPLPVGKVAESMSVALFKVGFGGEPVVYLRT
jgi:hypothetical protein